MPLILLMLALAAGCPSSRPEQPQTPVAPLSSAQRVWVRECAANTYRDCGPQCGVDECVKAARYLHRLGLFDDKKGYL